MRALAKEFRLDASITDLHFSKPLFEGFEKAIEACTKKTISAINPHRQRLLVASQKKTTVTSTPAVAVPDPSTLPDPSTDTKPAADPKIKDPAPKKRQDTIYNVTRKAYLGSLPTQIQYGIANPVQISGFRGSGLIRFS